ncbi:sigma-B regulation protein RsbU (phosphoserine phosphatase) [Desulfonatronum zhilinae]|nr:sigma-B regulation protein RsbU (phosphoserine phosphatase) [Desulfonatronum zhilinae]
MFHSLKTKIFLLVSVILALVTVFVLYFTDRDVKQAMFEAEQRSARNVLELVELNIQSGYRDLVRSRVDAVNAHRRALRGLAMVARTTLDEIFTMSDLSGESRARAESRALDWLSRPRLAEEGEFIVFDAQGTLLAHPDPDARGGDLNLLRDIKGSPMAEAVNSEARRLGEISSMFYWTWTGHGQPIKKFGWFVHYPPTDWIIGAAVDIDELEQEGERKLEELLNNLRANFSKIRIAQSGSVILFNAQGEVLIGPEDNNLDPGTAINALTGKPLLDELKGLAAARDRLSMRFVPQAADAAGHIREQEVFCGYFRALGWYVAALTYVDEVEAPARNLVARLSGIILAVLLAGLVLGLVLAGRIAKPLNALADYAKALPETDFTAQEVQDQSAAIRHLPQRHKDEVGRLATALMFMEGSLRENIRSLIETTAANERIEGELNVAREIQLGLLPKTFPPFPERREFDLFATLKSAKEVGGDLYDFFFMDEDHICFAVGDVSGKGVPAALFMAITRTLLRTAGARDRDPGPIMEIMNNDLAPDNPNSMFVTLFVGVLNTRTGRLLFANGGHNKPVIKNHDGVRFLEGRSGPMVGAVEDIPYNTLEIDLAPGEMIFLYTDGITEAMDEELAVYSDERLLTTMEAAPIVSAEQTIQVVLEDVALHVGAAQQSDDITALCLRFAGPGGGQG